MTEEQLAPFMPYAAGRKGAAVFVCILCFGIGALGFADRTAGLGIQLGLAIPFGIIGVVLVALAFRPPARHPVIVALRDTPERIVWVYPGTMTVNGRASQTFVHFGLDDGSKKALAIGARNDPSLLIEHSERILPHATIGFSAERAKQFKLDPRSMRRSS